ncbi:MAG: putative porin [Methylomonas sp.]|nr:putative porin [Methylomonas sp.]PPD22768.1 MAG: hypothetical protein CTY23_00070 [Methylomonas sp.]PPD26753.1 MAG: hypothetical protein CTY22_04125 [Methylomonas sp.]PPD38608.1 MAG: hypothetical protein CTY21_04125 [Methylomonas sp.]PPD42861.1 MAG: hypothetical protein CTY17_00395 [Methylomonas sp.]
MTHNKRLMALVLSGLMGTVQAGEKDELLKLRNTTASLIQQLVKQGILTQQMADQMIKQAEADAEEQAAIAKAEDKATAAVPAGEVRVAYVPDFVKDEIRQQVRMELKEEVVGDVMQKAKAEQWGVPGALPDWTRRFKLTGDLRLRSQNDLMANDNFANGLPGSGTNGFYPNVMAIHDAGGFTAAGPNAWMNSTEDRHYWRQRLRLGVDALIAERPKDSLKAGIRLATGNQPDAVSTNQNMGITGQRYQWGVDRAYLEYTAVDDDKFKWLTVDGGRIKNPWYTGGGEFTAGSELLFDVDLSFEGVSATYHHNLQSGGLANAGEPRRSLFVTGGAFPLQEVERASSDKWMFGGQTGLDWTFNNQDNFRFAVAYYDYVNVQAKPNTLAGGGGLGTCDTNSFAQTNSRPQFTQGGNTLAAICQEGVGNVASRTGNVDMWGLASDFNIINLNVSYDMALFAPYHLRFSADLARNIGFDRQAVNRLTALNPLATDVDPQTDAWQLRVDLGWPIAERPGHWNVFWAYKYVERDAVFDAFSDSDFRLGGSNNKGWFIGGNYGLMKNVWLTSRWLSADVVHGPNFGIDVYQLDINTRF